MKRYTEYKDSGVPWIGDIPGHWEVVPFYAAFREINNKGFDSEELLSVYLDKGVVRFAEEVGRRTNAITATTDMMNYKLVNPGDFVLNNQQAWRGSVGVSRYRGIISPAYVVLKMKESINPSFANYLLRSPKIVAQYYVSSKGVGSIQRNIYWQALKRRMILIPTPAEQEKIVAFLDKQTNLIESCICLRERELQTLIELKQAKIASAVTRGLNPDVPMKDSGIPWIGMIPAHWENAQLRKYLRLVSEKNHPEETLLSVTREQGVIIRNTDSKEENHNFIPDDLSGYKLVKEGQFVINKMKSWQGSYAVSKYQGIVSPAYYVCDLNFPDKEFFSIAIRSQAYIGFFTQLSKGIRVGQWDLSTIALKSVPFFEPPIEEQHQIVEYIKQTITSIDYYITSLEKEIEYLKEYKQRLISDVVTGKVDVRDEA